MRSLGKWADVIGDSVSDRFGLNGKILQFGRDHS